MIERTAQTNLHPHFSLLAVGVGSAAAQIVLLREVMASTGGNELIAALALASWILLTGFGALVGGRFISACDTRPTLLLLGHLLLAALPFALLGLARLWPAFASLPGGQPGFPATLAGCLVTFLPYGLISGAMVPLLGRRIAATPGAPGTAYAMDGFGSALGGVALGVLLLGGVPHVWCLAVAGLPHLIAATGRRPLPLLLGVAVLAASAATVDGPTFALRFPGQQVESRHPSPFGQTVVTRLGTQWNVYRDATPIYSTGDLAAEARIHPALCQRPEGARVLLLGGSVFGAAREACRHRPALVDCVEQEAAIFELTRTPGGAAAGLEDPRLRATPVRTITGDGRAFLRRAAGAYDAIVLDLPGPESVGWNRYYTREFFLEARAALRPGGVLAFTLASSPNYLGPEQLALERSIVAALRCAFAQVEVLPGERHYFLARDGAIDLEIAPVLAERGIATTRLLDYDWPELIDPFRREEVASLLGRSTPGDGSVRPNEDLSPHAFRHLLAQSARIRGGTRWIAPLALLSLVLLLLSTRGCASLFAVATSGAAVMGIELAALLLFQVMYGQLYLGLAAFVTLFLSGAAAGALFAARRGSTAHSPAAEIGRQIARADLALLLGTLLLLGLARIAPLASSELARSILGRGALPTLALLVAVPAGWQFAAAARGVRESSLAELYWADLAGAAFGTIAAGLIWLPTFGVTGVIAGVGVMKGASLVVQWIAAGRAARSA